MSVFIAVINVILIFYVVFRYRPVQNAALGYAYWAGVFFKLIAGIGVGLLYTHYYSSGDTFSFFYDATKLSQLARHDFGEYVRFLGVGDDTFSVWQSLAFHRERSLFMVKILSLFCLLTDNNYWLCASYFSLIAFAGAWLLVKVINACFSGALIPALVAFVFFPSVVFWSSGVLKESLAMGCLFLLVAMFLSRWYHKERSWGMWLLVFPAVVVLWKLKYYYLGVLLPVLFTTYLTAVILRYWRIRNVTGKVVLWLILFILPLFTISLLHPNFDPDFLPEVIVRNYQAYTERSAPGNVIHFESLRPTVGSILLHAPWAFFSGLFRPFSWEADNILKMAVALENVFLLILSLAVVSTFRTMLRSPARMLVFAALVYVVLLAVFLALSAPNFGTLARYRVGFLPFFVFLVMFDNPIVKFIKEAVQRYRSHLVQ